MTKRKQWLLPDGVDEVLPPRAWQVEQLRRRLLDVFERWGYELVIPPIVEYLESLLAGIGEDLDLQTFRLTDQVTGRAMGVRADITPQVARIDSHCMPSDYPQRFCYLGPVVHTLPDKFAGSRNPLQLGAELYGHDGIESDAEVIRLLLEILAAAGIPEITIELGHRGVFDAICSEGAFDAFEPQVLEFLLKKDVSGLNEVLEEVDAGEFVTRHLLALLELNGGPEVLQCAREVLSDAPASVAVALENVERLVDDIRAQVENVDLHVDLAELRGYRYHTGVIFAAYTPDIGRAIAWGGRYDNIGQDFGRSRSATGFSTDLKVLVSLTPIESVHLPRILTPAGSDPELIAAIRSYRSVGYTVLQDLPGQEGTAADLGCDQVLSRASGSWLLEDVD